MSKLKIDCDKVIAQGEELKTIANDYNKLINELYGKLSKVSDNGIWVSEKSTGAASKFISAVLKDKQNVSKLNGAIYNLGEEIIKYASDVKGIVNSEVGELDG